MKLNKNQYLILEKNDGESENKFKVEIANIVKEHDKEVIAKFVDIDSANKWIKDNFKEEHLLPLAMFSDEYRRIFDSISCFIKDKFEEQRLTMLFSESEEIISNIVLMGISIEEEKEEGFESVHAIKHHFLVSTNERIFVSHQIVYYCPGVEEKREKTQFDCVVPLFQNGSYFDTKSGDFVVEIREDNTFMKSFMENGIGKETYNKMNKNTQQEKEIAGFLENIDYPKILKKKTDWLEKIKSAYFKMLDDFVSHYNQ